MKESASTSSPLQPARTLIRCTRGLSSVEYLILLVVIGVASIATWNQIGAKVSQHATDSDTELGTLGQ